MLINISESHSQRFSIAGQREEVEKEQNAEGGRPYPRVLCDGVRRPNQRGGHRHGLSARAISTTRFVITCVGSFNYNLTSNYTLRMNAREYWRWGPGNCPLGIRWRW